LLHVVLFFSGSKARSTKLSGELIDPPKPRFCSHGAYFLVPFVAVHKEKCVALIGYIRKKMNVSFYTQSRGFF